MFRDILLAVTSSQARRFIHQTLLPGSLSVFSGSAIKLNVMEPSGVLGDRGWWGMRVPGWHSAGFFLSAKTDTDTSTRSKSLTGMFVPAVSCESQVGRRQTFNARGCSYLFDFICGLEFWVVAQLPTVNSDMSQGERKQRKNMSLQRGNTVGSDLLQFVEMSRLRETCQTACWTLSYYSSWSVGKYLPAGKTDLG